MSEKTLESVKTKCVRCYRVLDLEHDDDLGVETLGITNHRFYHWKCVKKDRLFAKTLRRMNIPQGAAKETI